MYIDIGVFVNICTHTKGKSGERMMHRSWPYTRSLLRVLVCFTCICNKYACVCHVGMYVRNLCVCESRVYVTNMYVSVTCVCLYVPCHTCI